ncbi:Spo0B domain-containing protein [Virgibacillus alimentarius]|uniref:Stage 0 sporulation protein B (Sporulation initiation phosphotransferase) n=1 Tax=Virgibacillus alimentarius TaxID=698769 RepID=A0ABS4S558_9BACI|nr:MULTISPECIES: Spo0B domain-containing protein [Virgibacillus]MBP2256632.1 stage 0 sporulation protein B (sporulation initiation phosphotransferase) [Virgibacillus alimentarius]HLR67928.1 Spo0B domain-containing protein [Virgibacillus sp.]
MNEKDVIQLLQYQRHEIMNELQIIQGYLSMGNSKKVKDKIETWMESFHKERKLFSLQAPLFTLWMIQFNDTYQNVRLTYNIHTKNKNLQASDRLLVDACEKIIDSIVGTGDALELYQAHIQLNETTSSSVKVEISIEGRFISIKQFEASLQNLGQNCPINVRKNENGITCSLTISCDR